MFDEYGTENCKIELIEEYPCENKIQLQKREGFHIQNTHCVNKRVEGQDLTRQEYDAQYWLNNKERISEFKSEKVRLRNLPGLLHTGAIAHDMRNH